MPSSDLTDDIIFQILIRLPVKSLLRFCCVCKSWRNLITRDQIFIKSHLQIQNQAPPRKFLMCSWAAAICDCDRISPDLVTPAIYASADLQKLSYLGIRMNVVGSCDGLLCTYRRCGCFVDSIIYVWNPALRQCTVLPRSICKGYWTIAVGFGYDPLTEDYKVVKVCRVKVVPEGFIVYKVGIYALKTHSWKSIAFDAIPCAPNPADHSLDDHMGVIHGGFLYWICGKDDQGCLWLTAFDIARATFQVILVPRYVSFHTSYGLRLVGGHLSISGIGHSGEFHLWVMEEGYPGCGGDQKSRWVKKFVLPNGVVRSPVMTTTNVTASGKILAYVRPANEREAHLTGDLGGRLVLYDPNTRRVDNVIPGMPYYYKIPISWNQGFKYFVADNYVESLVSVVTSSGKKISTQTISDARQSAQKDKSSSKKSLLGCLWV